MDSTSTKGNGQRAGSRAPYWINVGQTERWGSVGAGVALALAGMRRGGVAGAALVLSGGGLLLRGMTGHCYAYESLGMSTAEVQDELGVEEIRRTSEKEGAAKTRSFELHATDEGISGSGTDTTL